MSHYLEHLQRYGHRPSSFEELLDLAIYEKKPIAHYSFPVHKHIVEAQLVYQGYEFIVTNTLDTVYALGGTRLVRVRLNTNLTTELDVISVSGGKLSRTMFPWHKHRKLQILTVYDLADAVSNRHPFQSGLVKAQTFTIPSRMEPPNDQLRGDLFTEKDGATTVVWAFNRASNVHACFVGERHVDTVDVTIYASPYRKLEIVDGLKHILKNPEAAESLMRFVSPSTMM